MRVISQKNEHDVPYEYCTLWVKEPENIIYATPIWEPDTLLQMARYTTAEKAEKAMQKLHERYCLRKSEDTPVVFIFPEENDI